MYRRVLPKPVRAIDAVVLLALAAVTKIRLWAHAEAVLFAILCYWLWGVYGRGDAISVAASLVAALVLFFGKANYGLIALFLVPAYGLATLAFDRRRLAAGTVLVAAFPALIAIAAAALHVDLPMYVRGGIELAGGYGEAMFRSPGAPFLTYYWTWLFSPPWRRSPFSAGGS